MAINYAALTSLTMGLNAIASVEMGNIRGRMLEARGDFERRMSEANARIAETRAQDVLRQGETQAARIYGQAQRVKGSQRAAFAGQNVRVGSGVARQMELETDLVSAIDMQRARNNAWKAAWGIETQALGMRQQGEMAQISANFEAEGARLQGRVQGLQQGIRGIRAGVGALAQEGVFGRDPDQLSEFEMMMLNRQDDYYRGVLMPSMLEVYGGGKTQVAGWEDSSFYDLGDYEFDYAMNI